VLQPPAKQEEFFNFVDETPSSSGIDKGKRLNTD